MRYGDTNAGVQALGGSRLCQCSPWPPSRLRTVRVPAPALAMAELTELGGQGRGAEGCPVHVRPVSTGGGGAPPRPPSESPGRVHGVRAVAPVDPKVVRELRHLRRRRGFANFDLFDSLYRVYLVAIVLAIAVLALSGLAAGPRIHGTELARVTRDGPAILGALVAAAVAVALRSAGRGGPLALEAADVRHVLQAPIIRAAALRGPALQLVRKGAGIGLVAGAIAGVLAAKRLPGGLAAWAAAAALAGVVAGVLATGVGLVASGHRLSRRLANVAAILVLAWSAADVATGLRTSPATFLGELALWPLAVRPLALVGVLVAAAAVALGLASLEGVGIEAAERRASLVGSLRLAVTFRDVRTATLLRRQLSEERSRRRPWVRIRRAPLGQGAGAPSRTARAGRSRPVRARSRAATVARRDLEGALRWPGMRIARMVVLAVAAGLSLRAVWAGITPLVVVAALCLFVVALDAVEGLAQETDHPDRLAGVPWPEGSARFAHLIFPFVAMVAFGALGLAAALPFGNPSLVAVIGGVTLVPAAAAAVAGAAVSVLRGPADPTGGALATAPEMAGFQLVFRELLPPAIVAVGVLPVAFAHAAAAKGQPPLDSAISVGFASLLVPIAAAGWVHAKGRAALLAPEGDAGEDFEPPEPAPAPERRPSQPRSSQPKPGQRASGARVTPRAPGPGAAPVRETGSRTRSRRGSPPGDGRGRGEQGKGGPVGGKS